MMQPSDLSDQGFGQITEDSTIPLYIQLIAIIKRQIHSGALKEGDPLPSETQLCTYYGISRSTVRQA